MAAPSSPSWLGMLNVQNPGGPPVESPALPPASAPASGPIAPAAAAPAISTPPEGSVPETSLFGRVAKGFNDWRNDNRLTLMALGAGMAGAQSIGQGLNRGMTMAIPAMQADIKQQYQNQTVQALMKRGLPQDVALAAAANPALMQQLLPRLFGAKQWKIGERTNFLGEKVPFLYDEVSGETKDLNFGGSGGSGVSGGSVGGGGSPNIENFDLSKVNHSLTGEAFLNQYPSEIQTAARAYMGGGVMPTGNPRNNGIASIAKNVAQEYALGTGQPNLADDAAYPARRQMSVDLSKGQPGSLGGQITFGGTSLGHLADVAEKAVSLDNVNGLGIAPVARWSNMARGMTTDQAAKVNEVQGAIQHYGQEITKFYTGSPGGEAERMRFLNTIDTAKAPKEIAGAIRTERDLIPDRLNQIRSQIVDRLGEKEADKQLSRANLDQVVGRINKALAKLDPDGPEAKMMGGSAAPTPQPTAAGKLQPGNYNWTPQQGIVPSAPAAPQPPMKGARLGFHQDGSRGWFIEDPSRPGKHMAVMVG
jgi:hypothetical protein